MGTPYDVVYKWALKKIEDPALAQWPEEDLENELYGWMLSAIAKFRQCKNDLSDRDDELKCFNSNLLLIEQEILAVLMAREWLTPQLNSASVTRQVFGGKEEKYYSQSAHGTFLDSRDEKLKLEAQQLHRDYTYIDNDFFD
jgi:hypothetical protein